MMKIVMPQLGETVTEGTVAKWPKNVGDRVRPDELLFEVETEKVITEIPAQMDGIRKKPVVVEGADGDKIAIHPGRCIGAVVRSLRIRRRLFRGVPAQGAADSRDAGLDHRIEMTDTVFQRSASTAGKTCRGNSPLKRALRGFTSLSWGRHRSLRAEGKLK
jgi:Biotin-requiring enzyme